MEKDENKAVGNENDQPIDIAALTDGLAETPKEETAEDGDKTPKEGQTKKQSKEENARYAEARRQREKAELQAKEKEAREKEIYEQGYRKAQMDSVKTNPYTDTEITNEHDLEVYLKMKEFDDEGKDPLKEFPKYTARQLTEADEKAKAEEERIAKEKETKEAEDRKLQAKIQTEREELVKAHPDLNLQELVKNEDFKKYANGKFGRWTYLEIVDGWLSNNTDKLSKKKQTSSITSVASGSKVVKSFKDMTDDEYEAYCREKHGSF